MSRGPQGPFTRPPPTGQAKHVERDFYDIRDEKSLVDFIHQNKNHINKQAVEIDNLTHQQLDADIEPGPLRNMTGRAPPPPPPPPQFNAPQSPPPQAFSPPQRSVIQEELEPPTLLDPHNHNPSDLKQPAPQQQSTADKKIPRVLQGTNVDISKIPQQDIDRMLAIEAEEDSRGPQKVITNVPDAGEPAVKAPPISAQQMRRKVEEEVREDIKAGRVPGVEPVKTEMRFYMRTPTRDSRKFERFEPVTGCIFYPVNELFLKRFNLFDVTSITEAMDARDISLLLDTVGGCLDPNMDVRDLSIPDFKHILYWHYFNSYTSVPHDLGWTSKYGNKNVYTVTAGSIKMRPPKFSRLEYQKWWQRGYCIPTMREYEFFERERTNLSAKELKLLDRAQYFRPLDDGIDFQEKIDRMTEMGAENADVIQQLIPFAAGIDHGLTELVDVVDAKFSKKAWIPELNRQIKRLTGQQKILTDDGDLVEALTLQDEINTVQAEIDRLTASEEDGSALADVETLSLDRPMLEFLPRL